MRVALALVAVLAVGAAAQPDEEGLATPCEACAASAEQCVQRCGGGSLVREHVCDIPAPGVLETQCSCLPSPTRGALGRRFGPVPGDAVPPELLAILGSLLDFEARDERVPVEDAGDLDVARSGALPFAPLAVPMMRLAGLAGARGAPAQPSPTLMLGPFEITFGGPGVVPRAAKANAPPSRSTYGGANEAAHRAQASGRLGREHEERAAMTQRESAGQEEHHSLGCLLVGACAAFAFAVAVLCCCCGRPSAARESMRVDVVDTTTPLVVAYYEEEVAAEEGDALRPLPHEGAGGVDVDVVLPASA